MAESLIQHFKSTTLLRFWSDSMAMHQEIGFLVPLCNETLAELISSPRIKIYRGLNSLGRNSVSVSDKRISRSHLSLTASPRGSASLVVEGANPIVVRSGSERKKLCSRENGTIVNGDVIELIPGQYIFKYLISEDDDAWNRKRQRQSIEEKVSVKISEKVSNVVAESSKRNNGDADEEGIRSFCVSDDELPSTFRLLRVQGLPQWANTSCASIGDVVQGDVLFAVLSNYMVDIDWLLSACPLLKKIPKVLVVHGEGDGTLDNLKRKMPVNWILHKPRLPISFGTHHSKAMLLVYPRGVRVIVHTANLIHVDWNNKSQALWMQDFPWKEKTVSSNTSVFENDLVDYLSAIKWPEFSVDLLNLGNFRINSSFFRKFDYSDARVRLIASVPGYHSGTHLKKWGHMKLRTILQECIFDKEFKKSPLVYQSEELIKFSPRQKSQCSPHFSSLGSLDEKWMNEFGSSLSSGMSEDKTPLGPGEPLIIWPTVEDVRCSLEGYRAGNAIPSPLKNVEKPFLKKYWAKWKASHTGRCRAMPHIKTFARYKDHKLAWFLLTSANLSKAAWGALQKNNSQLMIRSYELGVLFLPYTCSASFSCTSNKPPQKDKCGSSEKIEKTELVTLNWPRNSDSVIKLPLPYELPPRPYSSEDVPWSWERFYAKKDVYGQVWPNHS